MREKVESMEKAEIELKRAMTEERREWIRIKETEFATVKEQCVNSTLIFIPSSHMNFKPCHLLSRVY
jgi:hypothetical protein